MSAQAAPHPHGPLAGIRVVDLTMVFLGPYCTGLMADLGADVIKVEPPGGDIVRNIGPSRNPGMGPVFLNANRNKRSVVLDLKQPAGHAALLRLVEGADVFVQSMRPSATERLGLGYEAIAAANPRIVYCSASGFGGDGPHRDKPAYDDVIQGMAGIAALQGMPSGDEPKYIASAAVDKTVGMFAFGTILAALLHRERTGEGQLVEVPMHETMVAFTMVEHMYGATFEPPLTHAGYPRCITPNRRPYRTEDGFLSVVIYSDRNWVDFFKLIGRDDLLDDPRYTTVTGRTDHIDELYEMLATALASGTSAEWLERLEAAQIPAMPVATLDDVLSDEHLRASGFLHTLEHPTEGTLQATAFPARLSATPAADDRLPAPRLAEHTHEVLREAGLSEAEIAALIDSGAAA